MDEMYEIILKDGFGLKLKGATRTRSSLICFTDKGSFDLKKNIFDESRIIFEGEIRKNLNKNGFMNAVPFIDTVDGDIFFRYGDGRYTLENHIDTVSFDEEEGWDYTEGAATLGRLHNASFMDDFVCDRKNFGRLITTYEKRITEFKRIRKRIKKDALYDKADMIIKKYYTYYLKRAEDAIKMVQESNYDALSMYAMENKTFCHNSFKGDNIKRDKKTGEIYVDNFAKASYDVCISDLAYYIRRVIKMEDTDQNTVKDVLEAYGCETHLTDDKKALTKAMVVFPWKFMSLCNEYYNKRKGFTFDASVQRIEKCIRDIEKEELIINSV